MTKLLLTPPNWAADVSWSRVWETAAADSLTGAEAREVLRPAPRQSLQYTVTPATAEARRDVEAELRDALFLGAAVPAWGRGTPLASSAAAGATVIYLENTDRTWQPAAGETIVLLGDGPVPGLPATESAVIQSVSGNQLTLVSALTAAWAAGTTLVYPVLTGVIEVEDGELDTPGWTSIRLRFRERVATASAGIGGGTPGLAHTFASFDGRPVSPALPAWSSSPSRSLTYDLREIALGFGAPVDAPTQVAVTHGWEITVDATTATEIDRWDAFAVARQGRRQGFWFPEPVALGSVASVDSSTQFTLTASARTLAGQPIAAVAFADASGEPTIRARVASLSGQQITLTAAPGTAPAVGAEVFILRYVRLAADEERAVYQAESWQRRTWRVIELPTEYAAVESGAQPVWLYEVTLQSPTPVVWRFTSSASAITSSSQVFTPRAATHSGLRRTQRLDRDEVTLEFALEDALPAALFLPCPPSARVLVKIWEIAYAAPDTRTLVFTGYLRQPELVGPQARVSISGLSDELDRKAPAYLLQPRCNYSLFDGNCGLSAGAWEKAGTITALAGEQVTVSAATVPSAAYLVQGRLVSGDGLDYEVRTIRAATAAVGGGWLLTLNRALARASVSGAVTLRPGCDGGWDTCRTTFANGNRFGGTPHLPTRNPTVPMRGLNAGGGKK